MVGDRLRFLRTTMRDFQAAYQVRLSVGRKSSHDGWVWCGWGGDGGNCIEDTGIYDHRREHRAVFLCVESSSSDAVVFTRRAAVYARDRRASVYFAKKYFVSDTKLLGRFLRTPTYNTTNAGGIGRGSR